MPQKEYTNTLPLTEAVYYILLSLCSPMHGYGIMQNTAKISNERVNLSPGTLYGALTTLLEKNWIVALPDEIQNQRKKEYVITALGLCAVKVELKRLKELLDNGNMIMKGVHGYENNN